MQLTWALGVLCLMTVSSTVKAESISERNFRILHGEPPFPPAITRASVETKYIEQKLDHFDENENRTWQMRYMSNDEFFKSGGPAFIFVGGEWAISSGSILSGHMYDMAKENNGYLFYTEHRYYGQSKPTSDLSTENLKYLHVKQALADLAHFIRTMKETIPGMSQSKFILTGGSYSATMVTWFKKLYPDLAVGCWASSAPLFAKVNFVEYKEVAGESILKVGGKECYDRIDNGIRELESMFANKRGAEVKAMLKLCDTFDETNDLDMWTLFSEISDHFAGVVQTHSGNNIQGTCSQIMKGEDDLTGLATYLLRIFGSGCNDLSYKAVITPFLNTDYNDNMMRQWLYQTCNEFGWYQTSGSRAQPFGTKFPLAYYTTLCQDVYDEKFSGTFIEKQVMETNDNFGGLKPEVENVYITHGELDPWRAMGIQDEKQATIIPNHAHVKDLASISSSDTAEMRAAKERIAELVREWVRGGSETL